MSRPQHGACKICNCSNEGDMNDINNRCKTITCLFKFNAKVVCSPTGKLNLFYSSLFKASGQIDTLIVHEKFSFN